MSTWKLTKPPPARRRRKTKRKGPEAILCDCGRKAVARATVLVGRGAQYKVTLYLCRECLKIEEGWEEPTQEVAIEKIRG